MKVFLFGQSLVERGLVSQQQLDNAVLQQRQANLRIGELAVELGLLTKQQALEINQLQKRTNKRFGDLAKEKGLLSAEQLNELLEKQQYQHRFIGEVLLAQGLLTDTQLQQELDRHQKNFQQIQRELTQAIDAHPLGNLLEMAISFSRNTLLRTAKCHSSFGGMVTDHRDHSITDSNSVQIFVSGDLAFTLCLAADNTAMVAAASKFMGIEQDECDLELARDAFGELLNILLGQMLTELVNEDMKYSHSTPDHATELSSLWEQERAVISVELSTELGQFILAVAQNKA